MKRVRYPAEFKAEAVRQITERGHGVVDVAKRLGMSDKSLYLWVRLAKDRAGRPVGKTLLTLPFDFSGDSQQHLGQVIQHLTASGMNHCHQ